MGDMSHDKADAKKASCLPVLEEMGSASAYGKWNEWARMRNEEAEGWEGNEDVRGLRFREADPCRVMQRVKHQMLYLRKASATIQLQFGEAGTRWPGFLLGLLSL